MAGCCGGGASQRPWDAPVKGLSYYTVRGGLGDTPPPGVVLPPNMDGSAADAATPAASPVKKSGSGVVLGFLVVGGLALAMSRWGRSA